MAVQAVQQNRWVQKMRPFLGALGIASIIGMWTGVRNIFWDALESMMLETMQVGWERFAFNAVLVASWGIIGWISYRGLFHREAPRTWLILTNVALVWILTLGPW
jgi:hypothetical protein